MWQPSVSGVFLACQGWKQCRSFCGEFYFPWMLAFSCESQHSWRAAVGKATYLSVGAQPPQAFTLKNPNTSTGNSGEGKGLDQRELVGAGLRRYCMQNVINGLSEAVHCCAYLFRHSGMGTTLNWRAVLRLVSPLPIMSVQKRKQMDWLVSTIEEVFWKANGSLLSIQGNIHFLTIYPQMPYLTKGIACKNTVFCSWKKIHFCSSYCEDSS